MVDEDGGVPRVVSVVPIDNDNMFANSRQLKNEDTLESLVVTEEQAQRLLRVLSTDNHALMDALRHLPQTSRDQFLLRMHTFCAELETGYRDMQWLAETSVRPMEMLDVNKAMSKRLLFRISRVMHADIMRLLLVAWNDGRWVCVEAFEHWVPLAGVVVVAAAASPFLRVLHKRLAWSGRSSEKVLQQLLSDTAGAAEVRESRRLIEDAMTRVRRVAEKAGLARPPCCPLPYVWELSGDAASDGATIARQARVMMDKIHTLLSVHTLPARRGVTSAQCALALVHTQAVASHAARMSQ